MGAPLVQVRDRTEREEEEEEEKRKRRDRLGKVFFDCQHFFTFDFSFF
jgi:hypothetical protein